MFVSKDLIPIREGSNTIYIRANLSMAARNRITDASFRVSDVDIARLQAGDTDGISLNMAMGEVNTVLMHEGIAKWEGPAFEGIKCTPANIDQLDLDEPLVKRVLEALAERMEKKVKESGNDG